ncbi:cation:proton antiporter [Spongiibacter taiwanensis]|uniref:cation:proton antiporter domain-containing protein n=1 Tax=Spongiibacter taiwanensis TaxID=1748242 RepID=UPI002035ECA8|nr:cation:proton antiporter [Spongiibacter taiwanensis]USA43406.1 cation:proton antiporter [Spongiibacter taiwanensis]
MASSLTFSFFIIFTGAALLASIALYTRQPLLMAYIVLGAAVGPFGAAWVTDVNLLAEVANIGILFLLFLLGLDMQPSSLAKTLRKTTVVALLSSLIFASVGFLVCFGFGYSVSESLIAGAAMMFSSTIIGIKLLPTTVLHHRITGELMVGLLLLQDLIAIFVLLILFSMSSGEFSSLALMKTLLALPLMVAFAILAVRYLLLPLLQRFDRFHEYIFLVAIAWCLGLAELGHWLGLSAEMGAFLAGISLATSPISQYIAINLKPLRDFFLILFFFSLGARFDLALLPSIALPTLILAGLMLAGKPVVYRYLMKTMTRSKALAWDLGFRMGQISEFSLLIAYVAVGLELISDEVSHLIQATAIVSFMVSSYIVVLNYPTPIALSDKLRRD